PRRREQQPADDGDGALLRRQFGAAVEIVGDGPVHGCSFTVAPTNEGNSLPFPRNARRPAAYRAAAVSHLAAAASSASRASTQRSPSGVSSSFQKGAFVFSQSMRKAQLSSAA